MTLNDIASPDVEVANDAGGGFLTDSKTCVYSKYYM
jgi:hypothetical protein